MGGFTVSVRPVHVYWKRRGYLRGPGSTEKVTTCGAPRGARDRLSCVPHPTLNSQEQQSPGAWDLRTPTGRCTELLHLGGERKRTGAGRCTHCTGSVSILRGLTLSSSIFRETILEDDVPTKNALLGRKGRLAHAIHTDLSEALAKHTGHATVQPDFSHLLYFFSELPSSSSSVVSVAFFLA